MSGRVLRRRHAIAGLAALAASATPLQASALHSAMPIARPLRIIVPQSAGGAADGIARLVGEGLALGMQHPLLVDNKPGGGSIIGTMALANAEPNGDTIGFVVSALAINQALRRHMPYDALTDFAPVCLGGYSVMVLVADAALPAADVAQLLALARRRQPPLQYASLGVASASHLAGELLRLQAGVALEHVPFNGSAQIYRALFSGEIALAFVTMESALPHLQSGRLRALGVTQGRRSPTHPHLPTIGETVPGFEVNGFFGFIAPAHTPPAVVHRLHKSIAKVLRSPAVASRLAEQATVVDAAGPEPFAAFLQREIAKYRMLAQRTGITVD